MRLRTRALSGASQAPKGPWLRPVREPVRGTVVAHALDHPA